MHANFQLETVKGIRKRWKHQTVVYAREVECRFFLITLQLYFYTSNGNDEGRLAAMQLKVKYFPVCQSLRADM